MTSNGFILGIETSTEVCSVALLSESDPVRLLESELANQHGAKLAPMIKSLLSEHIDSHQHLIAIALSVGPGSYTGLRVGMAMAKALCFSLDLPLIAMDSLSVLSGASEQSQIVSDYVVPMIDARRMEVYCSVFTNDGHMIKAPHAHILSERSFELLDIPSSASVTIIGNGAAKAKSVEGFAKAHLGCQSNSAKYMRGLSWRAYRNENFADVALISPLYLKSPNITRPKKKL